MNDLKDILTDPIIYISLFLTVCGGLFSLIKEWKSKANTHYVKNNTLALLAFGLVIAGALLSIYNNVLDRKQKDISDLKASQKDSINKVLLDSLAIVQNENLRLSREVIDQLTDGGIKPIVLATGILGTQYIDDGVLYRYYNVTIYIVNAGNRNIKSVNVILSDKYKRMKRIVKVIGSQFDYERYDPLTPIKALDFPTVSRLEQEFNNDTSLFVNNLPVKTQKLIYRSACPVGLAQYEYNVTVDWTNGTYEAIIRLDSNTKDAMKVQYVTKVNGKAVNTEKYFKSSNQHPDWFGGIK